MFDKSAENLENLQALHTSLNKALSAADQASQSGSPVDLSNTARDVDLAEFTAPKHRHWDCRTCLPTSLTDLSGVPSLCWASYHPQRSTFSVFKNVVVWHEVFMCPFTTTVPGPEPPDWTVLIAVVVSIGGLALLVLLIIGIIFCCRRRKEKRTAINYSEHFNGADRQFEDKSCFSH